MIKSVVESSLSKFHFQKVSELSKKEFSELLTCDLEDFAKSSDFKTAVYNASFEVLKRKVKN